MFQENYYDNEKYTYSLSAPTGSLVKLQFKSFGSEQGYDSLFLYNGNSTAAPLIGSYTGTNNAGTVISSGQNLTLRFKSDGSTNSFGFKAIKSCTPQIIVTGIKSNETINEVVIYPNPSSGKVFVTDSKIKSFQLFDLQGKLLLEKDFVTENEPIIDFNTFNIKEGFFFICLYKTNGNRIVKKLIYSN